MVTKEKRAYLRNLLDEHSKGAPCWKTFGDDETDIGRVRGHQSIKGFNGDTLGSFYSAGLATLATEAVNVLDELIDDLDNAEALLRVERDAALNAGKVRALELPQTITLQIPDEWLAGIKKNLEAIIAEMESSLVARVVELETEQGELHRELARLRGQLATAREDASEMEKKAIAEGSEALALRAEVAALKAAAQWRKMERAPRDGTEILIWVLGRHYELAAWEGHSCNQWVGDASRYDEDQVSVWLPIPAPPTGDGQ